MGWGVEGGERFEKKKPRPGELWYIMSRRARRFSSPRPPCGLVAARRARLLTAQESDLGAVRKSWPAFKVGVVVAGVSLTRKGSVL